MSALPNPSHAGPEGKSSNDEALHQEDHPDVEEGASPPSGNDPDARKVDPEQVECNPGSQPTSPDPGNPDHDAPRQPVGAQRGVGPLEPSGWAEMPAVPATHFAVTGTDILSITVKTTAVPKPKKASDRKPAPSAPSSAAGGGGDGPPTELDGGNEPAGPDGRKPRIEFSIPVGLEVAFKAAADVVRSEMVRDPQGAARFLKAITCVAGNSAWRSIAADIADLNDTDGKIVKICEALVALERKGESAAFDCVAKLVGRIQKDPRGAAAWYGLVTDACLPTLGNRVLRRGGLVARIAKWCFPELPWKEAAARRADLDKRSEAKSAQSVRR